MILFQELSKMNQALKSYTTPHKKAYGIPLDFNSLIEKGTIQLEEI